MLRRFWLCCSHPQSGREVEDDRVDQRVESKCLYPVLTGCKEMDRSRVCHILTPPTPAPTSSPSPPPLPVRVVGVDDDAECLINFFRGGHFSVHTQNLRVCSGGPPVPRRVGGRPHCESGKHFLSTPRFSLFAAHFLTYWTRRFKSTVKIGHFHKALH